MSAQGSSSHCDDCQLAWLTHDDFDALLAKVERRFRPTDLEALQTECRQRQRELAARAFDDSVRVVYHDCPQCGDRMSRRAFAPQSGIIVNLCDAHGLITSNADLLLAMNFIQRGGEMLTIAHQVEELEQQLTEASHQEREHERSRARGGMPVIIPFLM